MLKFLLLASLPLVKAWLLPTTVIDAARGSRGSAHARERRTCEMALESHPLTREKLLVHVGASLAAFGLAESAYASGDGLATTVEVDVPSSLCVDGPVAVVGASGKLGREVVKAAQRRRLPTRAIVREISPRHLFDDDVDVVAGDVRRPDELLKAVSGARAVIVASSASRRGGSPRAVDYGGVANVARACIACNVPRLVVISSAGVTNPDRWIHRLFNLYGDIMTYKYKGEQALRQVYSSARATKPHLDLHYTILRPGDLTLGAARGAVGAQLSQGDRFIGNIARADVAELCLEILGSAAAADVTFECCHAMADARGRHAGVIRGASWADMLTRLRADPTPLAVVEPAGRTVVTAANIS